MMSLKQKAMLERAKMEAQRMGNDYVGSEHLLLALLHQNEGCLAKGLAAQGIYYFQVRSDAEILFGMKEQPTQQLQITAIADTLLAQCEQLQQERPQQSFEDCMGEVLLSHPSSVAMELLRRYDVCLEELHVAGKKRGGIAALNALEALHCLNFATRQGFVEREEQLELLVEILLRREKANPLLVGEAGVGKSALVEALAQRIEAGEIAALKDHYIYALDINTLVAGTRYRGDFEEKLKKLIAAFRSHPNAILFIDELHQVIGAGRSEGSIDVASVLKPCLARRQLRCIGATTLEEYERHIEKDPALQRRFQCVRLMEPDPQQTRRILMARCEEYAGFHQVEIAKELIPTMIACADYYLPFGHFPDKALDVLDLSCAYARAHAQDKVDETCVREVIASLSQIPVDVEQRTRQTLEVLTQRCPDLPLRQLTEALQELGEHRRQKTLLGCWALSGEPRQCRYMLQLLAEEFFHQEDCLTLDMNVYPFLCGEVLQRLYRQPYTILCIEHFDDALEELRSLLLRAIREGAFWGEGRQVSLRHTLVVFLQDSEDLCGELSALVGSHFQLEGSAPCLLS